MRPHEVAASVEPAQWETILAAVRERNPHMWHELEHAACQDQRIPPRLWQRRSPADRRALVRRTLGAPASGALALDVLREYLLEEQRPLVIRFLDLAGVAHEEGVLLEGPVPEPDAATLDAAVDTLLAEEPRATALLYLRALAAQDNVEWPRLDERLVAEAQAPTPPSPPGRAPPPPNPGGSQPAQRRAQDSASQPDAGGSAASGGSGSPAGDERGAAAAPPTSPADSAQGAGVQAPDAGPGGAAPDVTGHAAIALPAEPRAALTPAEGGAGAPDVAEARHGRPAAVWRGPPQASLSPRHGQSDGPAATGGPSIPPANGTPARGDRAASAIEAPAPSAGRGRPLVGHATRKGARPAAPGAISAAGPAVEAVSHDGKAPARNGAAASAVAPTSVAPAAPAAAPAGPRDRRAVPRAPRPELPARLPLPPPEPPGLSALDRLLLRTRAATLAEAQGAPDAPELEALVDEVMSLSAERPRSAYHVGLLASSGNTMAPAVPTGSAAHAAWYHAGRLAGWAQRQQWGEITRFYTDEPSAAAALFRQGEGLDAWAGAWLLAGLLAADVPALAADVLRHCPAVASLAARETLLDAADALLRGDRPAETSVILDVLAALPPLTMSLPATEGTDDAPVAAYAARLRRAQAECLQAQGLFGAARARLEAALGEAAGAERARLLGALGLVAGEFAQLGELRLPEAEMDAAPWQRRLEAGAPYFRQALAADLASPSTSGEAFSAPPSIGGPGGPSAPPSLTQSGATATASLGLGALDWLSERPALARPHFEAALGALLAQPAGHQRRGVLPQAQFYLGACLLLDLDTVAHDRALDLLRQAMAAGFRASAPTWQRLLDLVALDASLADPLFALFRQQVDAPGDAPPLPADLVQAFLARCAPRSDAARRALARECAHHDLPAERRWELLRRLLRAQRQAGDPDGAGTTLDTLEGLALALGDNSAAWQQRWYDFLADPANYEPEWSWEDVLWSRVRTLEQLNRDDEAFWLLDTPFSRLLADATPEALAAAEDLLAHARALAVSPEARAALPEMAARLRARQEAARQEGALDDDGLAAQLRGGRVLRVLFVGGNETQARHENSLRAALEQRDETSGGRVVLEFRNPGFNSNWDKTLEAVRGYRGRVDALVLMPFVRTQLGRALRRLASEFDIPWVPCTGKGYDSMERALRLAILLAAQP
jgi:hypothetical protein